VSYQRAEKNTNTSVLPPDVYFSGFGAAFERDRHPLLPVSSSHLPGTWTSATWGRPAVVHQNSPGRVRSANANYCNTSACGLFGERSSVSLWRSVVAIIDHCRLPSDVTDTSYSFKISPTTRKIQDCWKQTQSFSSSSLINATVISGLHRESWRAVSIDEWQKGLMPQNFSSP